MSATPTSFLLRLIRFSLVLFVTSLLLSSPSMSGRGGSEAPSFSLDKLWKAKWIACPGAPERDPGVFHFRKIIRLAGSPKHFVVHVSADNRFILFVNGKRVGDGPARGDLFHWRFETYDLEPFLHTGDNLLAATVWNFGTHAPLAQMTDRTGFLLQGDGVLEDIANTDSSWQVEPEPGRGILPSSLSEIKGFNSVGLGERLDAGRYDWHWNDLADAAGAGRGHSGLWQGAGSFIGEEQAEFRSHGAPREIADAPNPWLLVPDQLPKMELAPISAGRVVRCSSVSGADAFPSAAVSVPPRVWAMLVLDRGSLTTAYPELVVGGGQGATIRLTYAEALLDARGEKGNRNQIEGKSISGLFDEFLPDGGENRVFTPLWWRTWRFLELDIKTADQPLRLEKLSAMFTAYPFEEKARFQSDDTELARIWQTGWHTARLCAHETYVDCPYYEQLQYVGDTRIQALISYVMTGDDRLARQAIDAFDDSRGPDGLTQSRYPNAQVQFIPPYSLLWVDMLHDYWWYRPDAQYVAGKLAGTRAVLEWFLRHQRPNGLLGRMPWWNFVDWTAGYGEESGVPPQDPDGGSAVITLQFAAALRDAAEMEEALGVRAHAEKYRAAAQRARSAVYEKCWDAARGLVADTPARRHFSQQTNILAVLLDAVPASDQQRVLHRILAGELPSEFSSTQLADVSIASYYFRFYLARALEHAQMGGDYLRLLGPWRHMLELGLSTWAEMPEPTRSDCHAWSAHPNYDLLTIVAGIRPDAPGFGRVRITPHLGDLRNVDAAMPHPKGMIQVSYRREASITTATITLPEGLNGVLEWRGSEQPLHAGTQVLNLP